MDEPVLASFSLTHVHYTKGDPVSYLCAWLALVPQALCVIYVTLIWSTREMEIILMGAGQLTCEILNWCLKRHFREERPPQMLGKGYGMPSSHAQYVTFFSTYVALFLLLRHTPHPTHTHTPLTFIERALVSVAGLGGSAAVATSRIYLTYHTPKQVLVGCGVGASYAVLWFMLTGLLRKYGVVDYALDLWPAQQLRVRDLVVHEDLVDPGWARWLDRRGRAGQAVAARKNR